jgi:hypothetical protein
MATVTFALVPTPAKVKAKARALTPSSKVVAKGSVLTPAKTAAMASAPISVHAVAKANAGLLAEPFHPPGIVVKIVGIKIKMGDQGRLCKEHISCGMVLEGDLVVCLWKVQLMVEGQEEMAIQCGDKWD